MYGIQELTQRKRTKPEFVNPEPGGRSEKGSALIITLLLVSILVALVVDFVYEVYIDSAAFSNWSNAQRASLIAKSGQSLSTQYLQKLKLYKYTNERETLLPVNHDFGPGVSLLIKVEDENAKFNINSIIEPNGNTDKEELSSLKKMFEFLNINPDLALAVADWIDPDSEPRLANSEDDAKNDFLWSVDELRLIEGIDTIFDTIKPYVTVYKNTGSLLYLININTAEMPVLVSLHPDMTKTMAQDIIDKRENFPFEDTSELGNVVGNKIGDVLIGKKISVKSTNYRITTHAMVNGITRIIENVMNTSNNVLFWRET